MFVLTKTTKRFIPSSENSNENPLTFLVKPPTKTAILDIQETIFKSIDSDTEEISIENIPLVTLMNAYFDSCVIGWENVVDEKGDLVEFTKENFENFNNSTILMELYNFCRELSESSEKN